LELKNGVNQINDAINSLNTVTQQNAVFADDMAQNSQSLAKQADNLVQMVAFFKN
jgi:methyl-accepting chemotaxis protein